MYNNPLPPINFVPVEQTFQTFLRNKVKELLGYKNDGFPGSLPVPFERSHFALLESEDFFVCEKSDGIRFLLYTMITQKGPATFVCDCKNRWMWVDNILFPRKKESTQSGVDAEIKYHDGTLIDGELVIDKDETGDVIRFLAYDLMALNGTPTIQRIITSRLGMLNEDVIRPYHTLLDKKPDMMQKAPFAVELKKMERSYGMKMVWDSITKLKHGNDGLIFTPVKPHYTPGIFNKLLKWKPSSMLTVDFIIKQKLSPERKPYYLLHVSHLLSSGAHGFKFYDHFTPDPHLVQEWKSNPPEGKVGEFLWDKNWKVNIVEPGYALQTRIGGWKFLRFRDDKDMANDEQVVQTIRRCIDEDITIDDLVAYKDSIRNNWKIREKGGHTPAPVTINPLPNNMTSHFSDVISPTSPYLPSPSVAKAGESGYFSRKPSAEHYQYIDSPIRRESQEILSVPPRRPSSAIGHRKMDITKEDFDFDSKDQERDKVNGDNGTSITEERGLKSPMMEVRKISNGDVEMREAQKPGVPKPEPKVEAENEFTDPSSSVRIKNKPRARSNSSRSTSSASSSIADSASSTAFQPPPPPRQPTPPNSNPAHKMYSPKLSDVAAPLQPQHLHADPRRPSSPTPNERKSFRPYESPLRAASPSMRVVPMPSLVEQSESRVGSHQGPVQGPAVGYFDTTNSNGVREDPKWSRASSWPETPNNIPTSNQAANRKPVSHPQPPTTASRTSVDSLLSPAPSSQHHQTAAITAAAEERLQNFTIQSPLQPPSRIRYDPIRDSMPSSSNDDMPSYPSYPPSYKHSPPPYSYTYPHSEPSPPSQPAYGPLPQKRKSKAMLEFILNDTEVDLERKRGRLVEDWET